MVNCGMVQLHRTTLTPNGRLLLRFAEFAIENADFFYVRFFYLFYLFMSVKFLLVTVDEMCMEIQYIPGCISLHM